MRSLQSKRRALFSFAALLLLLTGCLDNDNENPEPVPVGFVSIYHASPDAPGLDVIVDDRKINYSPLSYSEHSGYLNFYTGDREVKFSSSGAVNALVDTVLKVEDGNAYSIFVINQLSSLETLIVRDSAATPGTGKAMVRFVQLSPDAQPMDVSVNGVSKSTSFDDISFKHATPFTEVDAETVTIEVKNSDGSETILSADGISIRPGEYYTIVTRGFENPPAGNSNVLSLDVF